MVEYKMLVLGQSGSGKSTFIRVLQKTFDMAAYQEESILCQSEIQRTIVRSTLIILDALPAIGSSTGKTQTSIDDANTNYPEIAAALRNRLFVLMELIQHRLTPNSNYILPIVEESESPQSRNGFSGFTTRWKEVFSNSVNKLPWWSKDWDGYEINIGQELEENVTKEVQKTLNNIRKDLIQLWQDVDVRRILMKEDIGLEAVVEELLLNDLDRVTSSEYIPTEDDILKWRYRAVGTNGRRFKMGGGFTNEWTVIELGGSKDQRHDQWAPFLNQDVDVVVMLAPISGFNENLPEDNSINRVEDSKQLWRDIRSNQDIILAGKFLLLNKCDVFIEKLKSGIKVPYELPKAVKKNDTEISIALTYLLKTFNQINAEFKNYQTKKALNKIIMITINETEKPGTPFILELQDLRKLSRDMAEAVTRKHLVLAGVF